MRMNAYRISRFLFALDTGPAARERWAADREAMLQAPAWELVDVLGVALQGVQFGELDEPSVAFAASTAAAALAV